ncbi:MULTISPECIES: hypothetical protein [unclassified Brevundimonas]|uniref:hypothetical protein n=1 Tax=unclassified Brevundimonas TaxID=2622653 RepID=UPI003F932643
MSDTPPASAAADLAYLKRLAVAGRGEPAPFLLLMAVFGGAYGFGLLAVLLAFLIEGAPQPGKTLGPISDFLGSWVFIAAHLAFLTALVWTAWRMIGPNRARLNRAASATWSASFIALVAIIAALRLFTRGEPSTDAVHTAQFIGPILLVLWGSAWWVTAITSDRRWLLLIAVGSFSAAVALAGVGQSILALPIMCACLIGLAFVPAVLLIRKR